MWMRNQAFSFLFSFALLLVCVKWKLGFGTNRAGRKEGEWRWGHSVLNSLQRVKVILEDGLGVGSPTCAGSHIKVSAAKCRNRWPRARTG